MEFMPEPVIRWVEFRGLDCSRLGTNSKGNFRSRSGNVSDVRAELAWYMRHRWKAMGFGTRPSCVEVARAIGLRSHASVVGAVRRWERKRERNEK